MEGHIWYTYRVVRLAGLWKAVSGSLTEWSDKRGCGRPCLVHLQSGQTSEVVEGHIWYTYRVVRLVRLWKAVSGSLTEWSD